jgi:Secretion system C-terminal sorting domain
MKPTFYFILIFISLNINAQTKILFDASKAESAGNADWVIDADVYNLGFSSGPAIFGNGSESNPQRFATPAQSGITSSTPETYWTGALSSWAIDCVKQGYQVESLPYNGQITYGNSSNLQDLSNYKVFVIDEPNILFTASEKDAIINFVQNGGGLCMISDHDVSDRNNDGFDSPHIWNDLMTTNNVLTNPFGITFDYTSFNQTTSNVANIPANPILHGVAGNVTQAQWSAGTTMTLNTTQNTTVKGLIFKTGASNTGTTNVMVASSNYGTGKIVAIGDSSIPDDGTGDPNDTLYDGYIADASGNHQKLLMNAIIWLANVNPLHTEYYATSDFSFNIIPNPINNKDLKLNYLLNENEPTTISIFDTLGREIKAITLTNNELKNISIPLNELNSGIYICKISNSKVSKSLPFIIQ